MNLRSTAELVEVCNSLDYRELTKKEKLSKHGKKLIKIIIKEKRIVDFVRLWRQIFLDSMQPQNLPYVWEPYPDSY